MEGRAPAMDPSARSTTPPRPAGAYGSVELDERGAAGRARVSAGGDHWTEYRFHWRYSRIAALVDSTAG